MGADFGIVRDAPGETTVTLTQGFVGTVNWAAPEQRWAHHVTPAADVFGAGLILSWIVKGTPGSPNLGQLNGYPALATGLRKATSDRPSRRQQTMAELLEAVSRATKSSVSATTIRELVRAGDVAALSAHILARRSDHTKAVRVLPELRRTQVQDWFSNDPDGAKSRAANRWGRRGDSELLRKLRVSGQ